MATMTPWPFSATFRTPPVETLMESRCQGIAYLIKLVESALEMQFLRAVNRTSSAGEAPSLGTGDCSNSIVGWLRWLVPPARFDGTHEALLNVGADAHPVRVAKVR